MFSPSLRPLFFALGLFFGLTAFSATASACEIEVKVVKGEKPTYKKGDQVILEVKVFYTHRNCPEGIEATKFKAEGLEIKGAKKWKELEPGMKYARYLMAEITQEGAGKGTFHVRRTCDKEGGYGVLQVTVE